MKDVPYLVVLLLFMVTLILTWVIGGVFLFWVVTISLLGIIAWGFLAGDKEKS